MPNQIAPNHPKQKLLFYLAQDLDDGIRAAVRDFVLRLAGVRRWVNGPPSFVNSIDTSGDISRGDLPTETVGGFVEIYSALPPWILPREIDIQHLEEVTVLVEMVCDFSREHGFSIEFELDGQLIGLVEDGKMDRSLAEGLIGEWRKHLGV